MPKPRVVVTETGRRVVRKRSKISGWGVYACEPITKNSRIVEYAGEKITAAESDTREQVYQAKGHIWCFTLSRRYARDGSVGGGIASYINHACKPNCYSEVVKHHTIWIRAGRNIRKGEELTYNYFTEGEAWHAVPVPAGVQGQDMTARPPVRHVIYLHGFVSSPESSKAQRFGRELAGAGVGFSCPDLNLPDFQTLTTTRMLEQVRAEVAATGAGPIALVGSSLGGFVAIHAAARDTTGLIDRLVLLAPAVEFGGNRLKQLGERGIEDWRRTGALRVFHYGENRERDVRFELYEDAARYDAYAVNSRVPALIFQGRQDDSVPPETVERWAAPRANVTLRLLDDGHQLSESVDLIWTESARFFGLKPLDS